MAISFKNIKDPKLGLTDTISFGKLKGCRVCDVIEDYYEYLIWAEKQGYLKFQPIVLECIKDAAKFEKPEEYDPREHQEVLDTYDKFQGITLDDIPF